MGLVALASRQQTVLDVNVCAELVGRAQVTNTDEAQEAPGSFFIIARPLHSKKRSECIITCATARGGGRGGNPLVVATTSEAPPSKSPQENSYLCNSKIKINCLLHFRAVVRFLQAELAVLTGG